MKVVINQPYFLPYIGLFEKIKAADLFIINDFSLISLCCGSHRRVKVILDSKTRSVRFLTQLVYKKDENIPFKDILLDNNFYKRAKEIANSLTRSYGRAKHFNYFASELSDTLLCNSASNLAEYNLSLILKMLEKLNINTKVMVASKSGLFNNLHLTKCPSEFKNHGTYMAYMMTKQVGADCYISGHSGSNFLDESVFVNNGIKILHHTVNFKPYPQFNYNDNQFISGLSAIDLIFNNGEKSKEFINTDSVQ